MVDMSPDLRISREFGRAWGWLVFLGIILIIGGIALLGAPIVGGLVVTTWIAAIFMVAGVFHIIHAFQARGWSSGLWQGLSGLIQLVGGFIAFFNPLAGAVALTIVLAITFLIDGIVRIALAFKARPIDHWGWVLFGGVVSLLVGIYILVVGGSPAASLVLLGVFAGISFLFEGIASLMLGLSARKQR